MAPRSAKAPRGFWKTRFGTISTGTFSFEEVKPSKPEKKTAEPLTREQYDQVRGAMFNRDFSSASFALSHKMSPAEVNAAIRSSDYQDYQDSR